MYVISSSPGEELDDLFARALFMLLGVIAERSNGGISSGLGYGITSSIHFGSPGASKVLDQEFVLLVTFAKQL